MTNDWLHSVRTAAEYKKFAKECRRLAQQIVLPQDKRVLEELAKTWEILAKLEYRDAGRGFQ